jgi:hypothetical protein
MEPTTKASDPAKGSEALSCSEVLGAQGPPADESIEHIGQALDADPAELLRAAGRYATDTTFEDAVLAPLDAIGRYVREIKRALAQPRKI